MSSSPQHVSPSGWDTPLHALYAAYMGHFQSHAIPWYARAWGALFTSFDAFLAFGWPAVIVLDAASGQPYIATRAGSVRAFERMVKTRFGDTLPALNDMPLLEPTAPRPVLLRTVTSLSSYTAVHRTLPAHALSALRARLQSGAPTDVLNLWTARKHSFLALSFVRSEKSGVVLECGYAVVRCAHLAKVGVWPPAPDENYRKGHYVVRDYADIKNHRPPNQPNAYAWGPTQSLDKSQLPTVLHALLDSLTSPASESLANDLVLVSHDLPGTLSALSSLQVSLPSNVLLLPTAAYELALFGLNDRPSAALLPPHNTPRPAGQPLSLPQLLVTLNVPLYPTAPLANAGNAAFVSLLAFQLLVDPHNTQIPQAPPAKLLMPVTPLKSRTRRTTLPQLEPLPLPNRLSVSFSSPNSATATPTSGSVHSAGGVSPHYFPAAGTPSPLPSPMHADPRARSSSSPHARPSSSTPPRVRIDSNGNGTRSDRRTSGYFPAVTTVVEPEEVQVQRQRRRSVDIQGLVGGVRRMSLGVGR